MKRSPYFSNYPFFRKLTYSYMIHDWF
jgi:hypothetical protein